MSLYNCNGNNNKSLNLLMVNQPTTAAAWLCMTCFECKEVNSVTLQYWSRSGSERIVVWVSSNVKPTVEWYYADDHTPPAGVTQLSHETFPCTGTTKITRTIDCKNYNYMGIAPRHLGYMTCEILSVT